MSKQYIYIFDTDSYCRPLELSHTNISHDSDAMSMGYGLGMFNPNFANYFIVYSVRMNKKHEKS